MTQITKEAIEAARAQMRPFIPPNDETLARAIEAALPFLPIAVEGKIKPLEWSETSYGNPEAHSVVGVYHFNRAGNGGWHVSVKSEVLRDTDGRSNFATLDKAKAAAQSDFETRILSALISSPGNVYGGQEVEAVAKRVYEAMRVAAHAHDPDRKTPEWVERGNSLMQEEARRVARSISPQAQPASTALVDRLTKALEPFAKCAAETDYDDKERDEPTPDDEWAKFRLLVGDYRRARTALSASQSTSMEGESDA